ncbi:MAG: Purine-binding protein [Paracidovorax wautersii]|uniref:Purine-binding protein n=1 Tax=Paracidovorax wautersii TaxID=1177982 RepID=A0A7V8FQP4_9BURK|nr:MAG: Purine-binding protein [Paracidovorax wautersii]
MNNRRFFTLSLALLATATLGTHGLVYAQSAGKKIKVDAIYSVPYEQQWVGRIHQALKAAEARGEIEYKSTESIANADYERVVREYAMQGQDLIVGEAFPVKAAMRKVARDFPKTAFLMGSSGKPVQPNFSVFDNYIQEPAYLSGMVAGGITRTHKIGLVGGYPIPEVNRLMNAFMAGAREVDPQVTFSISFINSWFDPPKAKEATFAMIDAGADVMYAERFGVADAAKERGKLVIGNVINTQPQYPDNVVASALWHFESTVNHAIAQVKAGTFKGEEYGIYSHMKYGGASLAPLGTFASKVPADLQARVTAREADIQSGKFVVKIDDSAPKAK